MMEGNFIQIKGNGVPQSSDIVFIIEAKGCNNFSLRRKNMPSIVSTIAKELEDIGITDNRFADFIIYPKVFDALDMTSKYLFNFPCSRFAVVVFGGDDVFDEPHILMTSSQEVFSTHNQITHLFSQVPIGKPL